MSDAPDPTMAETIAYRPSRRIAGLAVGAHPGRTSGAAAFYRDLVPFEREPDGRRIDLRASARDPFGRLFVRRPDPRNGITIEIAVDASGSMAFAGRTSRMRIVRDLCATLAASARVYRDPLGLTWCGGDGTVQRIMPGLRRGITAEIDALLAAASPKGAGHEALLAFAAGLGGRPHLVFLVSDFLLPLPLVETLLRLLARHELVPVILRDRGELEDLPPWGLAELRDLETGRRRLTLLRPSLHAAWRSAEEQRQRRLLDLCHAYGRTPFTIRDRFEPTALGRHLLAC